MNLLLLAKDEWENEPIVLEGRRAEHLLRVLRVEEGSTLRAGVIDQGICSARVIEVSGGKVTISTSEVEKTTRPEVQLVLAVPRPKALSRILQMAASFGLDSITITGAWRVEKSYLGSARLEPKRVNEDLLLGLEQGRQCHLPRFRFWSLFSSFLEEDARETSAERFVLHPGATDSFLSHEARLRGPIRLAIGPDGGFIDRELQSLMERGYTPIDLRSGPLRTETAVAATLGQVALLRRQRGRVARAT